MSILSLSINHVSQSTKTSGNVLVLALNYWIGIPHVNFKTHTHTHTHPCPPPTSTGFKLRLLNDMSLFLHLLYVPLTHPSPLWPLICLQALHYKPLKNSGLFTYKMTFHSGRIFVGAKRLSWTSTKYLHVPMTERTGTWAIPHIILWMPWPICESERMLGDGSCLWKAMLQGQRGSFTGQ